MNDLKEIHALQSSKLLSNVRIITLKRDIPGFLKKDAEFVECFDRPRLFKFGGKPDAYDLHESLLDGYGGVKKYFYVRIVSAKKTEIFEDAIKSVDKTLFALQELERENKQNQSNLINIKRRILSL